MIRLLLNLLLLSCLAPAQSPWRKHVVAKGFPNQTAIVADFTGDGLPDIISADISNDNKRTILFTAPDWKPCIIHAGLRVIHSAAMDVDADGDIDFIGAQYNPAVVFWLERPANPLEEPWAFHLIDDFSKGGVNGVHGLMAGDIDSDGKPDLVASSGQPGGNFPDSIVWFKVPPDPRRAPAWIRNIAGKADAPGLAHYVAIGDVDGDGRNDIASAAKFPPDGNWFAWWRQPPAPALPLTPWTKQLISTNQEGATNILIADLNADGKQDFVASNGHGHGVFWFAAPDWKQHSIDSLIGGPHALATGDIDRDGDTDVATCAKNSLTCAWYENDGQGNFDAHVLDADQASYDIRLTDIDSDGDLDLLVAGQESQNVVYFENPGPPKPGPQAGALYRRFCAGCHNSGTARMPTTAALQTMSRDAILRSLETGIMKQQAAPLSAPERALVADFLARPRQRLADTVGGCAEGAAFKRSTPEWNGWGGAGLANWRNAPHAGLAAADIPKLELAWAYGFPGDAVAFGQPTISGGWLFAGSRSGRIVALDAKTGCTHWSMQAEGPVRTAPVLDGKNRLYIGDLVAQVYALDSSTGRTIWKTKLDLHPHARITAAPQFHEGRLYVTVSSLEEGIASDPLYPCCTFRGSVAALDAASGKILWQTYMVPDPPKQVGPRRYSPSGIGVWVTPTLDPAKRALYVTTGDNYTEPATPLSDAFVALSMDTGKILWSKQITPNDVWTVACISPDRTNCPEQEGPDADFGMPALLVEAGAGQRLLIAGQKSGVVWAVDPDRKGEIVWQTRIGKGGLLGGIQWGGATDGRRVYMPLSDYGLTVVGRRQYGNPDPKVGGGLFALDVATGRILWQATPPTCPADRVACSPAQSAAVTVMPGAVFSGAMDGVLRAHDTETGRVLWSFDTARDFETVNLVPARGGSMDGAGPVVVDGMVYTTSGYSIFGGIPGNILLAFRPATAEPNPSR